MRRGSATACRPAAALRHLARAALIILALAPATALAAGGGAEGAAPAEEKKSSGPRRDQAAALSGEFILLDPLFIQVVDEERDRTSIGGIVVRLQPNPERRVDACYAIPRILDELVISFYERRLTRKDQTAAGHGPARKRVEEVVKRVAGPGVFGGVSVFDQVPEIDDTSMKLSRACK